MKRLKISLVALVGVLFGCQQAELDVPEANVVAKMQTVIISAGIDGTDTKASLDSQTGAFTWQSGDVISVLATDGNFYDFVLEGEAGDRTAEFVGNIPEGATVTTVATYPKFVANGTANTALTGNTLNYVLPASWTYEANVSNVPMVATFEAGATHMAFKQVGGVMRFPVKNLPTEAKFIVTMNDKTITGQFPVDITSLGESCMEAGTAASEVVVNYSSAVDYADAVFNVPVPTGTYNDFTVTIKDAAGHVRFTKTYSADNIVNRATLLNMKEVVVEDGTLPDDTNYDVYGMGELPIDYWQDIQAWHNWEHEKMLVEYQKVKDAGMNIMHSFGWGYTSLEQNKKLLAVAEALGMKFIAQYEGDGWNTDTRINNAKEYLAKSPAYIGEHVWGEPEESRLDEFKEFADRYVAAMPDKEPWSVLYPSYYKYENGSINFDAYVSYIDQFLNKIPAKMLVYDFYGLGKEAYNLAMDYYWNLDVVRSRTLERRMPYGVITQSGRVNNNRIPTESDLRWSVLANLALGAKYISYFCYCNPTDDYTGSTFGKYMVTLKNELTENYYYIQTLNKDIKTIGKKLLYCHADGAIMSRTDNYPLFDNKTNGRTKYGPVKGVTAVSNQVACGCFRDARVSENGENYKGYKVMVVAQIPQRDITATLSLDPSVTTITVTQNNTSKVVDLHNLLDVTFEGEKGISLAYSSGNLTLNIPNGEALLIEF